MNSEDDKEDMSPFDKQIEEIKEYQENIYNPGHYIGTGRVSPRAKNLFESPLYMTIVVVMSLPVIYSFITKIFSSENVIFRIMSCIIGFIIFIVLVVTFFKKDN